MKNDEELQPSRLHARAAIVLASYCTGILAVANPSRAQVASENAASIEEVVVTARHRTESISKVGQSITAVTAADIESTGATDFVDFALGVPGLSFTYNGPGRSTPVIRGLAPATGAQDSLPSPQVVGIYFDDVPISSPQASQRDVPLYDINRVEVLRGPQGTLYGAGSVGGTIRYIANDPDLHSIGGLLNANVSSVSDGGISNNVSAAIGLPIIEGKLAARIVGFRRDDDGFIDNVRSNEQDANTYKTHGGRLILLGAPTDRLTARLMAQFEKVELDGSRAATRPVEDLVNTAFPFTTTGRDDGAIVSMQLGYDAGALDVTSITSYFERDFFVRNYEFFINTLFGGEPTLNMNNKDVGRSQEIRLASSFDHAFNFAGGLFYYKGETTSLLAATFPTPVLGFLAAYDSITTQDNEQYAVFGEAYYQLTPRVRFTGGLRYYTDEVSILNDQLATSIFYPVLPAEPYLLDRKISEALPKLSVEGQLTQDTLLYATIGRAARNGGTNNPVIARELPPEQRDTAAGYGPDSVWSYETGLKTLLLDGRLSVDTAVYYNKWTDYQVNMVGPVTGLAYTQNVGEAHTQGLEGTVRWRMSKMFTLSAAGSMLSAKTDKTYVIGGRNNAISPEGSRIGVPRYNYNFGFDARVPIGADSLWASHIDYSRTDGRTGIGAGGIYPDYGMLNLRTGIERDKWSLALFCRNATNTVVAHALNPGNSYVVNKPREIGISASYRL